MIASTGDPLLEPDAMQEYRERLLPLARVITPNLPEAEALLEGKAGDHFGDHGGAPYLCRDWRAVAP